MVDFLMNESEARSTQQSMIDYLMNESEARSTQPQYYYLPNMAGQACSAQHSSTLKYRMKGWKGSQDSGWREGTNACVVGD